MDTISGGTDSLGPLTYTVSDGQSVSEAIVVAVADATDREPTEMRPLYDVVDPDALNSLFSPSGLATDETQVTFSYEGCRVALTEREVAVERETF